MKEAKEKGNFSDPEMVSLKECLISLSDLYSAFRISSDIEKRVLLRMAYNLLGQQLLSKLSGRLPKDFITLLIYEHYQLLHFYCEAKQIPTTSLDYYMTLFGTIFKHSDQEFYEAVLDLLVTEHFSTLSKDEAIKIIFKDINIPSIAGIPLDKAIVNYSALCDSIQKAVLRSLKIILSGKPKPTEELDNEPKFKKFMEELPNFRTAFKKEIEKNHWFTEKSAGTGKDAAKISPPLSQQEPDISGSVSPHEVKVGETPPKPLVEPPKTPEVTPKPPVEPSKTHKGGDTGNLLYILLFVGIPLILIIIGGAIYLITKRKK